MAINKIQIFLLCSEKQLWKDFLWTASFLFHIQDIQYKTLGKAIPGEGI